MTADLSLVQQIDSGINQEYLNEWMAYRKEDLKKPMTPRAVKMLTRKLLKWSIPEQERLICHAIEIGWKTVYWVEPPKQSSRQTSIEEDLNNRDWAR